MPPFNELGRADRSGDELPFDEIERGDLDDLGLVGELDDNAARRRPRSSTKKRLNMSVSL
jgi:hypothetical protein